MSSGRMRKTILLVAMPSSIHVVRWLNQLEGHDWDVHLFPSEGGVLIHPEMKGVTFHSPLFPWATKIDKVRPSGAAPSFFSKAADFLIRQVFKDFMAGFRVRRLVKVMRKVRPNLVHSLEMQAAGYLALEAKKSFYEKFPPWLVTNWGSDIFLFGRLPGHKAKISDVLANCDYYSCECGRDVKLAREFGFSRTTMPVFSNTGGFNLAALEIERNRIPTSARKLILLKGYQHWAGRALVGLRALSRCEDILSGYTVAIYLASSDVVIAAELFAAETGIPVRIIPKYTPHQEILALHAQARISIGLSISDAISTSFLEAMVMGSFPIQSCTACADEWIEHGLSGMIVPPEDPDIIEMAIRTALSDDDLVNKAAEINWRTAQERLDGDLLKQKAIDMYSRLLRIQS